jgi:PAS domain-containing protein
MSSDLHSSLHPRTKTVTICLVDKDATTGGEAGGSKSVQLILARELASNLATPMFLQDDRGVLVYYNDAASLLFGRPFGEIGEIPGEKFGALLDLKTVDRKPLRRRDAPSGIAFFERRPSHQRLYATGFDGQQRLVQATAFPLFGTTEEFHGVVVVFWQVNDGDGEG